MVITWSLVITKSAKYTWEYQLQFRLFLYDINICKYSYLYIYENESLVNIMLTGKQIHFRNTLFPFSSLLSFLRNSFKNTF